MLDHERDSALSASVARSSTDARGNSQANARAERQQLITPQLFAQAPITGQHHAEHGAGVELGAGAQAQLREHGGQKLLGLVDSC